MPFDTPDKARAAGRLGGVKTSEAKTQACGRNGAVKTARKIAHAQQMGQANKQPDKPPTAVLSLRVLEADKAAYLGMDAASRERVTQSMQQAFARAIIETHIV